MKTFLKWCLYLVVGFAVLGGVLSALENDGDKTENNNTSSNERKSERSKWSLNEEISKMTDNKNIYAVLQSDTILTPNGNPAQGFTPSITFRCQDKAFDVILTTKYPLSPEYGNAFGKTLKLRLDSDKAFDNKFTNAEGSYESFFINNPKQFLSKLANKNTLLVEANFHRHGLKTLEFDLTGLNENIESIKSECAI